MWICLSDEIGYSYSFLFCEGKGVFAFLDDNISGIVTYLCRLPYLLRCVR